jgi:hypothetical protein
VRRAFGLHARHRFGDIPVIGRVHPYTRERLHFNESQLAFWFLKTRHQELRNYRSPELPAGAAQVPVVV